MIHNDWTKSEERKKNNGYGGCGYYRIIKVAEQLKDTFDVTVWGNEWEKAFKNVGKQEDIFFNRLARDYDIIWMHYIDNPKLFSWLKVACERHGTKIVMDIDDNFLDLDPSNPANEQMGRGKAKRSHLATILSFCDAITVSTLPLKNVLTEHFKAVHGVDKDIFIIPNCNEIKEWDTPKQNQKHNGLVIGYMGSISHQDDLNMILPAIKKVMEKYPDVGFQLMGQLTLDGAKKVFGKWKQELRKRIIMIQPTATQKEFPEWLSTQPWDIGIAPLVDSPFNQSKSHIKWMEYSMFEIPTVASKVYPYYKDVFGVPTIEDMETGVLAREDEWEEKLSMLIEDEKLRKKLGKNAYEAVKKNWQYKDFKKNIIDTLHKISVL